MSNHANKLDNSEVARWKTPHLTQERELQEEENRAKLSAYSEGHREGYAAGMKQAQRETQDRVDLLEKSLEALSQPFSMLNLELTNYIAKLAGKIAHCIVRKELQTKPSLIKSLVRDAVSVLDRKTEMVEILVNPANVTLLNDLINPDGVEKNWIVIPDQTLGIGDCQVRCGDSLVDANLETRIDLILNKVSNELDL
jgi:flagellar assembly protein FliH